MAIDIYDLPDEEEVPLPRRRAPSAPAVDIYAGLEGSSAESTEPVSGNPDSFLGRLGLTGQNVVATHTAGRAGKRVASAFAEQDAIPGELEGLTLPSGSPAAAMLWEATGIAGLFDTYVRGREKRADELSNALPELRAKEKDAQARVQSIEGLLGPDSTHAMVSRAVGGFAANAEEQLLPTAAGVVGAAVAGPVGAVSAATLASVPLYNTAKNASYRKAREEFGATIEEAEDYATLMATLEFAPSALGGGASGAWTMAAKRLGLRELTEEGVEKALLGKVRSRTSRILGAGAIEAADEVAAGGLQDLAEVEMMDRDFFSSPQSRIAIATQVAENADKLGQNTLERAISGAIPGVAIATPSATYAYAAEVGANTANDIANASKNTLDDFVRRRGQPTATVTPTTPPAAEPIVEQAPVQPPVEEAVVEPAVEPVVEEEQAAPTPAPAAVEDDAAVRRSDIGKIQYWKRENDLDDDVYRQHLTDLTGKSSAADLNAEERRRVIEDLSGKPYEAPIPKKQKEAPVAPSPVQDQITDMAKDLGLLNQKNRKPVPITAPQATKHETVVKQIFRALNKGNTQKDVDVRNLSKQGKVVFAPNPQSLGFEANDSAQASYDPATGRMYVWTNNFNEGENLRAETIVAAMHEAGHAAGVVPREGRSAVLKYMLTDTKYDDVNNKIKQAAKDGNTIAEAAVFDAMVAAGMDPETLAKDANYDAILEGLEIVPYLATHVTRARNKPLGRVSGAWSDLRAGMRAFARDNFGTDTEFDINELMSATQKFTSEAIATDTIRTPEQGAKPRNKSQVLNMVGGRQATGFSSAQDRERLYQGYVDKKDRFEFSDSESAITNDTETVEEFDSGVPVYLGELLGHESLYEQYPDATVVVVQHNPALDPFTAFFVAANNLIEVGPYDGNQRRLRSILLHEVQHWIQEKEGFVSGFNDDLLMDPAIKASKELAATRINSLLGRLDLPKAIEQLPEDLRTQWDAEGLSTADTLHQAELFLGGVYGPAHPNGHVRNRARRYRELNAERMNVDALYQEQLDAAWDAYIRDYGEAEARNVQRRANVDQDEMDAALDPNPEYDMEYANFKVPVERTQDSMKLLNQKTVTPKASKNKADNFGVNKNAQFKEDSYRPEVVAWAKRIYGELHAPNGRPIWQNFVEWFGDSTMVEEDGTPIMVYHGTKAKVDFDAFLSDYEFEIGTHVGTKTQSGDPRFVGSLYSTSPNSVGSIVRRGQGNAIGSRVIPLFANFKNPLHVEDSFGAGPTDVMRAIFKALDESFDNPPSMGNDRIAPLMEVRDWMLNDPEYTESQDYKEAYKKAWVKIRDALQELGYDSFSYQNIAEGFLYADEYSKSIGITAPGKDGNPAKYNYYPYASDFPEISYVALDPKQLKSANNSGDFSGRTSRLLNQRARNTQIVYHGTPHTFKNKDEKNPLGKFDLSFMSSGEGVQAVGFGFYFSGAWDISDGSYRKALVSRGSHGGHSVAPSRAESFAIDAVVYSGDEISGIITEDQLEDYLDQVREMRSEAMDRLAAVPDPAELARLRQQHMDQAVSNLEKNFTPIDGESDSADLQSIISTLRQHAGIQFDSDLAQDRQQDLMTVEFATNSLAVLENSTAEQVSTMYKRRWESYDDGGELYYVEIPTDDSLADWNAKFDEQPENVRVAIDYLLSDLELSDDRDGGYLDAEDVRILKAMSFRDMYYYLARVESRFESRNGEAALSAKLDGYGIPGHKFKPIFGGGKKQPYFNYVIYDPASAKIVGRDAREKGQTRQDMLGWAATIADRNAAKIRAWESDARQRLERESGDAYGRMLYMATRRPQERKPKLVPGWLRSIMGSTGGTNRTIREIQEHAVSSPAMTRMLAENYEGQYRTAVRELAKQRRTTEAEIDRKITDAVDSIDQKTSTYDQNLAAFKAAVKPFGKAGQVLIEMREMVDNISLEMLRDRAARAKQGEAMSPAEKKTYSTIMANLGRYGHRQYAAHLRDAGFGEAVWGSYQKAKDKKPLTPEERANAARVVKALKVLVDDVLIPDEGKLATASQDRIDRLYSTWVGGQNLDALSYDEKRAELDAMREGINGDTEAIMRQAEKTAEEILGLHGNETGMIAQYYRGGKADLGILKQRQKLPPAIRELMGEIKDPAMRLLVTASKQSEFVARNQMLLELTRVRDPYHIQPPGPSGRPEVKGMKLIEGDAYGAMNGYYVSPELSAMMRDNIELLATFEDAVAMAAARPAVINNKVLLWAWDKWANLAATTKMLQIIGNAANFQFNLLGGPRMMLVNGNLNPKHLVKALGTAKQLIAYARNPALAQDEARRVTGAGVVDSAFIGEISSEQYRTVLAQVEKMVGTEPSAKEIRSFFRKAGMTAKETYAMMDVMYKIANFYQQADAVLPEFYKAEGVKKTQQELDREAADITNRTNITYKRAATFVKALERGGITQFGTYLYEVFRTEVQNLGQGVEELARANNATTPEGRRIMTMQATRRVGGQLFAWGLTAGVSKMLAELTFGDDEEDKYLRYLLPEYARGKDFISLGKDKAGRPVMFEFSRYDPVGPATDIMRRMINLEMTPEALGKELLGLYIYPRIAGRLVALGEQTLGDPKNVPSPILETVWPSLYQHILRAGTVVGVEEDTTRAWTRLFEVALPGGINAFRESNPKIVGSDGTPDAVGTLTRFMGVSLVVPEPSKQMSFAASEYDDTVQNERRKMASLARSYDTISDRDVMRKMVEARANEFNMYKDAHNIYRGMKALGMSDSEISGALKDARVSKDLIKQLRSGEFKSQTVSKKSFNGHRDTAIRRASTKQEKEEIKKKWDEAWEIVKGVASDD